jgi:type 1 fimbria pilin
MLIMKLKNTALTLAIFSAITASGMANAGKSQLTMKVGGTILPASCEIGEGSSTTSINLGRLSASKLNDNEMTTLAAQTAKINIVCPSYTAISLQATDVAEKAGQVEYANRVTPEVFSLGATSDGKVIGGYFVAMQDTSKVDGRPVANFIQAPMGSTSWVKSAGGINANNNVMYSWAVLSPDAPALGKVHSIDLKIVPFIEPASTLNTSENIEIRGEATYDLVYL